MVLQLPTLVSALVDQLKRINAGAAIVPTRIDSRLVMIHLSRKLRYDFSALRQTDFSGLCITHRVLDGACTDQQQTYFLIDLDKSTL